MNKYQRYDALRDTAKKHVHQRNDHCLLRISDP